jgi:PAS domain S-box-containing protein
MSSEHGNGNVTGNGAGTQQALRASELSYRRLFEAAQDGILILDVNTGRIIDVNPFLTKLLGFSHGEMVGKTVGEMSPFKDIVSNQAMLERLQKAGYVRYHNLPLETRDGRKIAVEFVSNVYQAGDKKVIQCNIRDNTDYKLTEEKMRQLSQAVEQSPVSVVITDTKGIIEYVNRKFSELTGYSLAEVVGKNPSILKSGECPAATYQEMWARITSGGTWSGEFHNRKKNGELFWERAVISPVLDASGEATHFLAVKEDITERKRAEAALIRLAAIVESSDDAIIGKDLNGIITNWNKGAEKIYGYKASEMVGTSIMRLIPADRHDEENRILETIKRGESMKHFETLRQTKDGRLIDVSVTTSPIRDVTGKIIGVSKVARDITERRKLEAQFRQSQKMEAVGQLAGGVAHDFNNILAVIQLQTGLLKAEQELSLQQLDLAGEIEKAAERAAILTRQLLLFSRRQTMQPRDRDLNQAINDMAKMLRRTLGEDIQLQFKFAMQSLFIHADAGMMDQVLMNLAVNARDAMPKGGQLVIETSAEDFDESVRAQSARASSGSLVCLSVSDTGCGIPPEVLPRIFEPFFTTKEAGKGTGLGLATVFGIVEQHQGWINVHSEVGHGTTFHIYLPQLTKISKREPEQPTLTSTRGGNETILLVEDDIFLRASVRKSLSQLGYRVLEAIDGIEALEVWKQNRGGIHLLLTDLVMPGGMTGKDLGERLLKENPKLKVIYASGYSGEIAGKDFPLEEGVNFLAKPFQTQKLAQTVRNCLDNN